MLEQLFKVCDINSMKTLTKQAIEFSKKELNIKAEIKVANIKESKGQVASIAKTGDSYTLFIDEDSIKYAVVSAVCHEMTHVAQMERGDLKQEKGLKIWKGVAMTQEQYNAQYHSEEGIEFENEAFEMQRKLSGKFWE